MMDAESAAAAYLALPMPDLKALHAERIAVLCQAVIDRALEGKRASIESERGTILAIMLAGGAPTQEQADDLVMMAAINTWETAMVDVRNAAIASATELEAITWPAPPARLKEWLNGF